MNKEYDEKLSGLIPNLKAYPSKRGSEGTAYFIDKEFVVKYFERMNVEYGLFDNYCSEIQHYADGGYSCPKIYSWAKVPICEEDNVYKYYILQERIPGEDLFPYSIGDIEEKSKVFCSKDEFLSALDNINENKKLYKKIMKEYSDTVLRRSEQLESLSRDEIRRFISTYIEINKNAAFSLPDLHVGNILFDGKSLTLIDQIMVTRRYKWLDSEGNFKDYRFKYDTLNDLIYLFSHVRNMRISMEHYEQATGEKIDKNILKNEQINKKLLGEFMQKWTKECKELLVYDKLDEFEINSIFWCLKTIVDEKSEQKIIGIFDK